MPKAGRKVRLALTLGLLAVALAAFVPAFTDRPVVSYASSGSMEPTIGVLDGFFVNPWPIAIEPGDIIVFDSVTQGGPAVHRVVAAAGAGWITRGDANERNDQDFGEPVVTRERVLGKVVTRADGEPIVLRSLGEAVLETRADLVGLQTKLGGPRQSAALAFLAIAAIFALPTVLARKKPEVPTRIPLGARVLLRRLLPRGVLGRHVGTALLLVLLASTAISATHARQDVSTSMVVLQDPSAADGSRATGPGGELRRDIEVSSLGILPTFVIVEGDPRAIRVPDGSATLAPNAKAAIVVWQRAGDAVGLQEDKVHVWRYPAVLPERMILALHHAYPASPYLVVGGLCLALGAAWFAALRISTLPVGRALGIREDWL